MFIFTCKRVCFFFYWYFHLKPNWIDFSNTLEQNRFVTFYLALNHPGFEYLEYSRRNFGDHFFRFRLGPHNLLILFKTCSTLFLLPIMDFILRKVVVFTLLFLLPLFIIVLHRVERLRTTIFRPWLVVILAFHSVGLDLLKQDAILPLNFCISLLFLKVFFLH